MCVFYSEFNKINKHFSSEIASTKFEYRIIYTTHKYANHIQKCITFPTTQIYVQSIPLNAKWDRIQVV